MARRPIRRLVIAGTLLALAGCGAGGGSKASPSTSSAVKQPPASTTGQQSATDAFVDIQTCDNAGGKGSSTGTIENHASKASVYTITIGFVDGNNNKVGEGTDTTTSVSPGASADWKVTVSGLGPGELVCHTLNIAVEGPSGNATTTTVGAVPAEFPCDLITQSDIGQIVQNPVEPGDATTNHVTEDNVSYTARECSWNTSPGSTGTDTRLQVSRAQDNAGADPGCPPLPGSTTPVTGVGTSALWSWTDPGTAVTVGTLRVCSERALIDVTISGSTSGDAHLAAARAIAEKALTAL